MTVPAGDSLTLTSERSNPARGCRERLAIIPGNGGCPWSRIQVMSLLESPTAPDQSFTSRGEAGADVE